VLGHVSVIVTSAALTAELRLFNAPTCALKAHPLSGACNMAAHYTGEDANKSVHPQSTPMINANAHQVATSTNMHNYATLYKGQLHNVVLPQLNHNWLGC
jgi:hypothetical protein